MHVWSIATDLAPRLNLAFTKEVKEEDDIANTIIRPNLNSLILVCPVSFVKTKAKENQIFGAENRQKYLVIQQQKQNLENRK